MAKSLENPLMTGAESLKTENNPNIWAAAAKGRRFGLFGIINLTPDSFHDGGKYIEARKAVLHASRLLESGAAILDLGAESTRPGADGVPVIEEKNRLWPAFCEIVNQFPDAIISIDTWHAETARFFLANGARIINDVSGLAWDDGLYEVIADKKPGYVLTHSKGRPGQMQKHPSYDNVLDEVKSFFDITINRLVKAGLPLANIVLDPGIGFGKNLSHNMRLMAGIEEFEVFGCQLLAGISMKSWLGDLLDLKQGDRGTATATASAILWRKGVFWHRVHEPWLVGPAIELACAFAAEENRHGPHTRYLL